jgi:hypothetical protein
MFAKRFVGWLLIWTASMAVIVLWFVWQRSELPPYRGIDQAVSDLMFWAGFLLILIVPGFAYRDLRQLKRKLYIPQQFVAKAERRQLARRLRHFYS